MRCSRWWAGRTGQEAVGWSWGHLGGFTARAAWSRLAEAPLPHRDEDGPAGQLEEEEEALAERPILRETLVEIRRRKAREARERESVAIDAGSRELDRKSAAIDAAEADHALRVAETAALECPGVALCFGNAKASEDPMIRFERGFADLEERRPIRPDTIFRLFSMTKPIVSASILPLIQNGRVTLTDPISKWLPEFEPSNLSVWREGRVLPLPASSRPIRVLDVLRHTTGMFYPSNPANGTPGVAIPELCIRFKDSGVRASGSPREFARRLATVPLCHEPGQRFTYSVSTALVACIVEEVTGLPYEEYLDEVLLSPLGMRDTGFFLRDAGQRERLANVYLEQPDGIARRFVEAPRKIFTYEKGSAVNADGGLFSTMADYERFVRFLVSNGRGIISPALLRTFVQDRLRPDGLAMPEDFLGFPAGFGLGCYVHPTGGRVCGWSGLANTHFWFDAHTGRYAILMAQKFPFSWRYQQLLTDRIRRGLSKATVGFQGLRNQRGEEQRPPLF